MPDNPEIKRALSQGMKSLMSEMKFEDITVADICKAGAVSRRSFYRYFQDKYALLNYVHYDDYCRRRAVLPRNRYDSWFCHHIGTRHDALHADGHHAFAVPAETHD